MACGAGFYAVTKSGECHLRDIGAGHAHCCERRQHELSDVHVVEADDRHVSRRLLAGFEKAMQHADGGEVIGADDCGGRIRISEEFRHRGHAAFKRVIALEHEI